MAASLNGVFASDTQELIKKSKVFVVGAGGIGCEVLKNLVLCGFPDIEIIDLDTIDTSNLNRQFLFHKEHVGKSKAVVAKESALKFNPDVKITAYHDSIFDTQFGVNFFKKFNVVLSALDNRQARNHVNRMCLNAQVPLIESGTAGYHGQVELIQKDVTQCYECMPKATQKTFPACTIRNTPSELIHCIVWAKHLFNQLFGESSEGEDISPDMADPEQGDSAALGKEDEVRVSTRQWAIDAKYDPHKLFNKFFSNDIKYLLAMANLWKTRKPPKAIEWGSTLLDGVDKLNLNDFLKDHHRIWTFVENAAIFADCVRKLKSRMDESPSEGEKLAWDKDDTIAMDFVASCANIRAFVFDIGQNSRFEIKSMAGNIIPAIATTNAITAGMSVLMAFKVLKNDIQNCGSIYVRNRLNPRNQYITPENFLVKPNPSCYVCSQDPAIHLKVDTEKVKLKELRDQILKNTLNMVNPDVIIDTKGIIVISSEDGETESNDNKTLKEMAIVDGVILNVDDFFQNYELRIIIVHMNSERDGPLFEVVADPSQLKPEKESSKASKRPAVDVIEDGPSTSKRFRVEVIEDDDDIEIIEDDNQDETPTPTPNPSSSKATKRKPAQEENGSPNGPSSTKRAKRTEVAEDDDDDVTIIE